MAQRVEDTVQSLHKITISWPLRRLKICSTKNTTHRNIERSFWGVAAKTRCALWINNAARRLVWKPARSSFEHGGHTKIRKGKGSLKSKLFLNVAWHFLHLKTKSLGNSQGRELWIFCFELCMILRTVAKNWRSNPFLSDNLDLISFVFRSKVQLSCLNYFAVFELVHSNSKNVIFELGKEIYNAKSISLWFQICSSRFHHRFLFKSEFYASR